MQLGAWDRARQIAPGRDGDNRIPIADEYERWHVELAQPRSSVELERKLHFVQVRRCIRCWPANEAVECVATEAQPELTRQRRQTRRLPQGIVDVAADAQHGLRR